MLTKWVIANVLIRQDLTDFGRRRSTHEGKAKGERHTRCNSNVHARNHDPSSWGAGSKFMDSGFEKRLLAGSYNPKKQRTPVDLRFPYAHAQRCEQRRSERKPESNVFGCSSLVFALTGQGLTRQHAFRDPYVSFSCNGLTGKVNYRRHKVLIPMDFCKLLKTLTQNNPYYFSLLLLLLKREGSGGAQTPSQKPAQCGQKTQFSCIALRSCYGAMTYKTRISTSASISLWAVCLGNRLNDLRPPKIAFRF